MTGLILYAGSQKKIVILALTQTAMLALTLTFILAQTQTII